MQCWPSWPSWPACPHSRRVSTDSNPAACRVFLWAVFWPPGYLCKICITWPGRSLAEPGRSARGPFALVVLGVSHALARDPRPAGRAQLGRLAGARVVLGAWSELLDPRPSWAPWCRSLVPGPGPSWAAGRRSIPAATWSQVRAQLGALVVLDPRRLGRRPALPGARSAARRPGAGPSWAAGRRSLVRAWCAPWCELGAQAPWSEGRAPGCLGRRRLGRGPRPAWLGA
jgi:hypothetical protein